MTWYVRMGTCSKKRNLPMEVCLTTCLSGWLVPWLSSIKNPTRIALRSRTFIWTRIAFDTKDPIHLTTLPVPRTIRPMPVLFWNLACFPKAACWWALSARQESMNSTVKPPVRNGATTFRNWLTNWQKSSTGSKQISIVRRSYRILAYRLTAPRQSIERAACLISPGTGSNPKFCRHTQPIGWSRPGLRIVAGSCRQIPILSLG